MMKEALMHSLKTCRKASLMLAALLLGGSATPSATAYTLNFSARLMPGTCTFNLSQATVELGTLTVGAFQPSTLVGSRPFTLSVTNCRGTDASLTPMVVINGEGSLQDGRWLFRASDSTTSSGIGVMLVRSNVMPVYSDPELRSNDTLDLAAQGVNPLNQDISFYVGATCGSGASCTNINSGQLIARVMFELDYR
jgi:type 1 fimbria pilin